MKKHWFVVACLMFAATLTSTGVARAHYLWVHLASGAAKGTLAAADAGENLDLRNTAIVVFEEQPRFGDGGYLDPFVKGGKTWMRALESDDRLDVAMKEVKGDGKRWLQGTLPKGSPRSIESTGKFGVYTYGKTEALLYYYAKYLDVREHEAMHELARARQLDLDVVPHPTPDELELKVLWKSLPAANLRVYVRGPKNFRQTIQTDQKGVARCKATANGRYTCRVTLIEAGKSGVDAGRKYDEVRHSSTVVLWLPVK